MKNQAIQMNHWIDDTARICGEVVVDCSDAAGTLQNAMKSAGELGQRHLELETITQQLSVEIEKVAYSTFEARQLSDAAREKVTAGSATIDSSMAGFSSMIELINRLGKHITGFAAAMEQVKVASQAIDSIARTTNMLALNAAIEAQKAGDAGKTFAVVAAEVKKLAFDSRTAAVEITGTVNSLSNEVEKLAVEIGSGISESTTSQLQFAQMGELLGGLSEIVSQVDERTAEIATTTSAMNEGLSESRRVRKAFEEANDAMQSELSDVHMDIHNLEHRANTMFDKLVHSGMSREDSIFVELALQEAANITQLTETAIERGELKRDLLFDTNLVLIEGSKPERFRSGLSDWADANWRPALDEISKVRSEVLTVVCSSSLGFLPTHMTEFSRIPTGEFSHDSRYCRNGRVFLEDIDIVAKASEQDYLMAVYRHSGAVDRFTNKAETVVRNVYVPLRFEGRRWGDLEIAYIL